MNDNPLVAMLGCALVLILTLGTLALGAFVISTAWQMGEQLFR